SRRSEGVPFQRTKTVSLRRRRLAQPDGGCFTAGDAYRNLAEAPLTAPCAFLGAAARGGGPPRWGRRRRGSRAASFSQDSHWIGALLRRLFTSATNRTRPVALRRMRRITPK